MSLSNRDPQPLIEITDEQRGALTEVRDRLSQPDVSASQEAYERSAHAAFAEVGFAIEVSWTTDPAWSGDESECPWHPTVTILRPITGISR